MPSAPADLPVGKKLGSGGGGIGLVGIYSSARALLVELRDLQLDTQHPC